VITTKHIAMVAARRILSSYLSPKSQPFLVVNLTFWFRPANHLNNQNLSSPASCDYYHPLPRQEDGQNRQAFSSDAIFLL